MTTGFGNLPLDWPLPAREGDFKSDPLASSLKNYRSIEEMYVAIRRAIPQLPNKGDLPVGMGTGMPDILNSNVNDSLLQCDDTADCGLSWTAYPEIGSVRIGGDYYTLAVDGDGFVVATPAP